MKYFVKPLILFCLIMFVLSCKSTSGIDLTSIRVADESASDQTKLLFNKIQQIQKKGIAFGHQDATMYGIGWKHEDDPTSLKSDIKAITGEFPVVHGYDIGHIELGNYQNLDTVSFNYMREHIQKLHSKGAIITMSWHLDNPVSGGSSWDTTAAVAPILKGGTEREKYELWIHRLSNFFKSLVDRRDNAIPIIFRPYHEMNGSWFWWGADHVSPQQYKQLWIETQELIKNNDVHSLLYAYSPNTMDSIADFEKFYPGDQYVDILGVDIYNHSGNEIYITQLQNNLDILRQKAAVSNKPYALTESGNNNLGEDKNWWTQVVLPGLKDSGIAWALFWRNARASHYFSTYPGEISEEDFKEFANKEEILFLNDIQKISN